MRRTVNSTGRLRITRQLVSFDIQRDEQGVPVTFSAQLEGLRELNLPADARVVVEAYYSTSSRRFDFGTIGNIVAPDDRSLSEVDKGGEILFRVKVVDYSRNVGMLLASGDRIPAKTPLEEGQESGRKPLLPVKVEHLGERIWDISVADTDRPYLLVNSRIPDLAYRIKDEPLLRGAVLVEAFRRIVDAMLRGENKDLEWVGPWKVFLRDLGVPPPETIEDDEERDAFVADAAKAFADRYAFASKASETREPEAIYGD